MIDENDIVPNLNNKLITLENGFIPLIKSRGIKFVHLNIHSLTSKIDELNLIWKNSPFDVIALSETLCDDTINDSEACTPILIGAFYRPPNVTIDFFDKLDSNPPTQLRSRILWQDNLYLFGYDKELLWMTEKRGY